MHKVSFCYVAPTKGLRCPSTNASCITIVRSSNIGSLVKMELANHGYDNHRYYNMQKNFGKIFDSSIKVKELLKVVL